MGLNTDCFEQMKEEKKFVTAKVIEMDNKRIGFEVMNKGEKQLVTPEQIMACFLVKVKEYFERDGLMSNKFVISIPTYASNVER